MTKTKTEQAFEADYDDGPTKRLKTGSVAADLVAYESLGLGKLPPVMSRALDNFVLGHTEWSPTANARLAHTAAVLKSATKEQRTADAQAVSNLLAKGPDAFAKLGTALDSVDIVAQAETAHSYAHRTANAVNIATKGQQLYLNRLVGSEYREAFLDLLDTAWRKFVIVSPTDETKLGELHRMQSVSAEARELIGRLLSWAEGQNRARGFTAENTKAIREAVQSEAWDLLPTLDRIEARTAEEAANSPKAMAEEKRANDLEQKEADDRAYAQQNAQYRRGLGRIEENTGETSEEDPTK